MDDGAVCVLAPDEASTGRYDSHVSAFKHTPAATGQVVTRCNVVQLPDFTGGLDQRLEVTYRDPDGLGTRSQVQADLIQARPDGSTLILAHFDSNRFTNTATATHTFGYHHAFDFSRNAYYVDVRVTRSTTSLAPSVSTVRLSERGSRALMRSAGGARSPCPTACRVWTAPEEQPHDHPRTVHLDRQDSTNAFCGRPRVSLRTGSRRRNARALPTMRGYLAGRSPAGLHAAGGFSRPGSPGENSTRGRSPPATAWRCVRRANTHSFGRTTRLR